MLIRDNGKNLNMWLQVSKAFGKVALEYEAWYQENPLYESELLALKALGPFPKPALEIGVGTGVFARALGFTHGLDPSFEMLNLARKKDIQVVCGVGEALPFKREIFGACALIFTLCFVSEPLKVFQEIRRVLKGGGLFILGFIPKDSAWGSYYLNKKKAGHHLYRWANFFSREEVLELSQETGFRLKRAYSSLFQSPKGEPLVEEPKEGLRAGAGFLALLFEKV